MLFWILWFCRGNLFLNALKWALIICSFPVSMFVIVGYWLYKFGKEKGLRDAGNEPIKHEYKIKF